MLGHALNTKRHLQMSESELKLLRERDEALKKADSWRNIALGLFVILAMIIVFHYFPSAIPPEPDPAAPVGVLEFS